MFILRIVKFAVLLVICIVLVVSGVANMEFVSLRLLPPELGLEGVPPPLELPLTVVILGAMLVGFIIGEIFEWIRETKHRRERNNRGREIQALRAENARLKAKLSDPKEDLPRIAAQ
ncbi:MAG: lipopolysaccharide assembly protein LapA domain-containing protein [Pseudomonadota bacterium]